MGLRFVGFVVVGFWVVVWLLCWVGVCGFACVIGFVRLLGWVLAGCLVVGFVGLICWFWLLYGCSVLDTL